MKEEKCDCSFCKLRKIENENTKKHLGWLQECKDNSIKKNQEKNLELISLCVDNK